jgi:hypothetical protein
MDWKKLKNLLIEESKRGDREGRFCPVDQAERVAERSPVPVQWGYGGPVYSMDKRAVVLPWLAPELLTPGALGALCHEIGHAEQAIEGTLLPSYIYGVTPGILREEANATLRGLRIALEEDAFHPAMVWYLGVAWLSYFCLYMEERSK